VAFDVTVVSALQQAMVAGSVVSDGYAVTKAFDRKLARVGEACRQQGLAFIPVAADTLGEWHPVKQGISLKPFIWKCWWWQSNRRKSW